MQIKMRTWVWMIAAAFLASCHSSNTQTNTSENDARPPQFDTFLTKFAQSELPVTIRGCSFEPYSNLPKFETTGDSLYTGGLSGYAYGRFKANGDYTAVIALAAADCLLPVIITYDKTGKQIDEKQVAIGQCGSGPGFSCREVMYIRADYSLYTADSMSQMDIDSNDALVPGGSRFDWVVYRTGKISSEGKIELSAEITDTVRMNKITAIGK